MRNTKPLFMALLGCLIGCLVTANALGQQGNQGSPSNPANRYVGAYKQYLGATCPLAQDSIMHFVYFARDRESIQDHPLLTTPRLAGAQIMYTWRELEPQRGEYDFSVIQEDYAFLLAHGKKLFIQLQDVTFYAQNKALPNYVMTDEFDGGCIQVFGPNGEPGGWVTKRWNKNVQDRFAALLMALGQEFDGKVEGINLQESALGFEEPLGPPFTPARYAECLKENMLALKTAFPTSTTMQYANFMPGEWLPWNDKGYLRGLYQYGEEIGVGLGGPDLMVQRKGQLNHTIAMMHEGEYTVPLGIAIQDGNYVGATGADQDYEASVANGTAGRKSMVPLLHAFAKDFLGVRYMFWVHQEPYFTEDVVPCLSVE